MENIKRRNPVWVVIFSIITAGIYFIYWVVKTKEEIKSLGAHIPSAWLLIVPIGNVYFMYKYLDGFSDHVKKDHNGVIWFLVGLMFLPVLVVIVQMELNKLAK